MLFDLLEHNVDRLIEANALSLSELGDLPQRDGGNRDRLTGGLRVLERSRLRGRELGDVGEPPKEGVSVEEPPHRLAFQSSVQSTATMSPWMVNRSRSMPRSGWRGRLIAVTRAIGSPRLVMVSASPRVRTPSINSRQRALNSAIPIV